MLSELLGIDITLERREESVGRFSLDLIGRNNDDGSTVIVENQLGGTDHSHLGQLLTYAGGLDAQTIIWIASEFRRRTQSSPRLAKQGHGRGDTFYGVVVRAVKIGDSLAAPELSLAAKPNDFEKVFKASNQSQSDEEQSTLLRILVEGKRATQEEFVDFRNRKYRTGSTTGCGLGTEIVIELSRSVTGAKGQAVLWPFRFGAKREQV